LQKKLKLKEENVNLLLLFATTGLSGFGGRWRSLVLLWSLKVPSKLRN